jgi:transcriptional regulator with XRE-family HTH domain
MTDASARALGRKVAFHRMRRGLSQRDLAAAISRSETWVSQVERGVRRIDRMTVLRTVAEALDVPLAELAADTPIVAEVSALPAPARELRMLLSSAVALRLALEQQGTSAGVHDLRTSADRAWELAHSARYDELVALLNVLIPDAERMTRKSRGAAAFAVLARTYHAAAAALAKLNEPAAAWVAADRAICAAERTGDPLLLAEGMFRLTLVFQTARLYEEARTAATTAVESLSRIASTDPAAASLFGALHLQLAVVAGRQNRADDAYHHLGVAAESARLVGPDENHYNTEFGPTNVALHRVSVAVELGDAGTALRAAAGLDAADLSVERQARLQIDLARAHMQRRNAEAAIAALAEAARLAPELARHHWMVRNLLTDLQRGGHRGDHRVRALTALTRSE